MQASTNTNSRFRLDSRSALIAVSVLAIHGAVIATIATLDPPPPVAPPLLQVALLSPPVARLEPPPIAPPEPRPPEPRPPEPPPPATVPTPVTPPPPAPVRPVPRPASPRPPEVRPIPVPPPASEMPTPASTEVSSRNEPAALDASITGSMPQHASAAATPVSSPSPAPAETKPPEMPAIASPPAPGPASAATRSGPRVDASWAGNTVPAMPGISKRLREEGTVRLSVHINEQGRVIEARLTSSSGFSRLDSLALETVKTWRFTPATVDGKPVADWYHDWSWKFGD